MSKYGVPHHSQNPEVSELILKNTYKTKKYILPSGNIINYQGYENFAFDELLQVENILEDDLTTDRKKVPEIWYTDKDNKKRRHFVDIYVKSQNRCIEVKSTWTNQSKNNVLEKQKAAIDLGYKYEIWIFDNKGTKLQVL
jgi:predicted AAA+ superfamily ATPase